MLQDVDSIDAKLLKDYQSLIGSLLYCAVNTRPDVAFAVGLLCRAMGRPIPELYEAALRVLFYLSTITATSACDTRPTRL